MRSVRRVLTSYQRLLPALAWTVALYLVTALTSTVEILPMAPPLIEARNIVTHTAGYAVLAALVAWALGAPARPLTRRETTGILALSLVLGVGQESLQTALRGEAYLLNSLFDLLVDVGGAALGLWLVRRRHAARRAAVASQAQPVSNRNQQGENR